MDENIVERKKPECIETYEKLDKECMWAENSLRDQIMYPESNLYKVCLKSYLKAKRKLDEYNNELNDIFVSHLHIADTVMNEKKNKFKSWNKEEVDLISDYQMEYGSEEHWSDELSKEFDDKWDAIQKKYN